MTEIRVTQLRRAKANEMMGMRDRGLSISNIAGRLERNRHQIARYIRLYLLYGEDTFAQ